MSQTYKSRLSDAFRHQEHNVDFCVVGGGLAGMFAAIQAARKGLKVVLMHDRPVLGGNASSEIRMWPRGCHGENNQESGLYEEMLCENMYRNPERNYSVWDSVLYGMARMEPNLTVLYSCSCYHAAMDGSRIVSIEGWQLTTYTVHIVHAKQFADCSGDSILAPLVNAKYSVGREARQEHGEDFTPDTSDCKTMGLTCMMQAREKDHPVSFTPPAWAKVFPDESMFQHRAHHMSNKLFNYWWIELGGDRDSLHDTEEIRDDLLATVMGVWDHIKNHGDHGADNWELEWIGFLPGKRESRRYEGAYVLTERDIQAEGRFDDLVAYGGWTLDDHDPAGFHADGPPNINGAAPTPYGIPYRSLYSANIDNLYFAGRNISATHVALSSTRVMATCAVLGQAIGMAAYVAHAYDTTPDGVYQSHIEELKQELMYEDCYLPFNRREISRLTKEAKMETADRSGSGIENLRSGYDRPIGEEDNGAYLELGKSVYFHFDEEEQVGQIRLVFDSDLNRYTVSGDPELRWIPMMCNRFQDFEPFGFPETMTRAYRIEYQNAAGEWIELENMQNNYQRVNLINCDIRCKSIRFTPLETWGSETSHVFAMDIR